MAEAGWCSFETALGPCALAWSRRGIVAVALPGDAAARVRRRAPGTAEGPPPAVIAAVLAELCGLLRGEPRDLAAAPLDLAGVAPFPRRVYAAARAIPRGATIGYGELAARLGAPCEARAVGAALARNPFPLIVPCHRVIAAGGRLGGFSAPGGAGTKRRLLALEGVEPAGQGELFQEVVMEGGCACGAVRYRLTEEPLIVHACHCRDCQRITGSAFVVNVWIERSHVETLAGAPRTYTLAAGSGRGHDVCFCARCGTTLWSRYHAPPGDTLFVRAGTLDRPEDATPDVHIFTRSKAPWLELPGGARAFEAMYPDFAAVWAPERLARFRRHVAEHAS